MTNANDDRMFRAAYEMFSSDHDQQRDRLLRGIADAPARDGASGPANEGSAEVPGAAVRRNAKRSLTVLATVLLVALIVPSVWDGSGQKAYGIDDLPQRLLTIRSLEIRRFLVQETVAEDGEEQPHQFPFRYFFERPGKLWLETYGFRFPGEGQPTIVRPAVVAIDDDLHMLRLLDEDRTLATRIDPRLTELLVEHLVQTQMFEQLLGGPPDSFRKTASETVQGISCEVYEATQWRNEKADGSTHRVWLNPNTGVPLQVAHYHTKPSGEEKLASMMVEIRVNKGVPADLFALRGVEDLPPAAADAAAGIGMISSGGAGPMRLVTDSGLCLRHEQIVDCSLSTPPSDEVPDRILHLSGRKMSVTNSAGGFSSGLLR